MVTTMHDLRQIVKDNGGDDTPALDTHNLTGRAAPEGVEPQWVPLTLWNEDCGCGEEFCCRDN